MLTVSKLANDIKLTSPAKHTINTPGKGKRFKNIGMVGHRLKICLDKFGKITNQIKLTRVVHNVQLLQRL